MGINQVIGPINSKQSQKGKNRVFSGNRMTVTMATSFIDNSQRGNGMRNSIGYGHAPPSPQPDYYNNMNMQNMAGGAMMTGASSPAPPPQSQNAPIPMHHHQTRRSSDIGPGTNNGLMNGSNHGGMNGGSSHANHALQNGAPPQRRVMMQLQHKAASSRAVMIHTPHQMKLKQQNNGFLSPQPHPQPQARGSRRSLVGFDPMLADHTATATPLQKRSSMYEVASAPTTRRTMSPNDITSLSPPLAPFAFDGSDHNPRPTTPPKAERQQQPVKRVSIVIPSSEKLSNRALATKKKHPLTPTEKRSQPMVTQKQHRKGAQSFCVSDLRSVSSDALEEEQKDGRDSGRNSPETDNSICDGSSSSSSGSSADRKSTPKQADAAANKEKTDGPQVTTPETTKQDNSNTKSGTPKKALRKEGSSKKVAPDPLKDAIVIRGPIKKSSPLLESNRKPSSCKKINTNVTPPRTRKLQIFGKMGHRRTRSLESKEIPVIPPTSDAKKATEPCKRASLPATPASEGRRPSMYPGVVQDLMEIKFNVLQIPSLAKPSPTSFLTGKEDEVARTCEHEPAPHQTEIPSLPEFVVAARLNEFVENYRRVDQNFDLQQWAGKGRMDLRQVKIAQHRPIARSLLECGDSISLQGFISKGTIADERLECVIFEGQRQFTAVFRGTTEQQTKLNIKTKKKTCPLDKERPDVEVYQCFLEEYVKLEPECFALLDKLTEENPFCDLVFSGHSFGAAMATIAAFRYANARPMMRVSCLTTASPKVGFSIFRNMVNSQPNLKVMRLEFGQDGKCQLPGTGGSHVGHTLVLHGSLGHNSLKTNRPVLAYKFEVPKFKKFKTSYPDLRSYVTALEELARLDLPWAKDFVGTSGQGVVVGNEARQVV